MAKPLATPKATLRLFTRAVNRFAPHEPQGYVAVDVSYAPVRSTREAAYRDFLEAYLPKD
jgi:hypothetical protein